mgnify:CR=1 FL=1
MTTSIDNKMPNSLKISVDYRKIVCYIQCTFWGFFWEKNDLDYPSKLPAVTLCCLPRMCTTEKSLPASASLICLLTFEIISLDPLSLVTIDWPCASLAL